MRIMTADRYHHGDLPNALRRAAAEVIAERGLGAFSLREVARRAGVSHTAPAHHFGDVRGLLTSLAAEGFQALHATTSAAAAEHPNPIEQLQAIGVAYISLARSHPGHCAVMYRVDVIDRDDPTLTAAMASAYDLLERTLQQLIDREQLGIGIDDATWMCWSAMQGLVQLEDSIAAINAGKGQEPVATSDLVRRFTTIIVGGMRAPGPGRRTGPPHRT